MWTLVRQWRQKRVLMRPEAAFPYVFAAEGAQHPPKGRHAHRPSPHHPPRSPTLAAAYPRSPPLTGPRRISRHAQRRSPTLHSYCKKIETNLSEDILVSIHYVRWSCVWNRLIARTGGLPPNLRSGRLRPERQVLQERQAQQVQLGRPDVQELRRLELRERQLQCRRPERVRARFSRRGCRCTSGR